MTDRALQIRVEQQLAGSPLFKATSIGVAVDRGVVTLMGHVGSFAARTAVEQAARTVAGVRAVANDLTVQLPGKYRPSDSDIALEVATLLESMMVGPLIGVAITVTHRWVTLSGRVDQQQHANTIVLAVERLSGVHGVTSELIVDQAQSAVATV